MLAEGEAAPRFELPALIDGAYRRVSLDEFLDDDVVILAFVPGAFNPACDETSCGLDELDLFTMQKDVSILGISPDSVYSHRAFADAYDLKVPLLADTDREVARKYDVEFVDDIGQHLVERAVVVVDHDGVVRYTWSTTDPERLPDVEAVKDAIAETGGDDTAFARYRVGQAHFTEGRRAFTSAMGEFSELEWMMAQGDFRQARDEFDAAADHFDTAARFVDDPALAAIYDGAMTKANALWQAADWLAKSASEYSSGNGVEGQQLREDAEGPLQTARDFRDPPDPDDWPPDVDDLRRDSERESDILPDADEGGVAALEVDIDTEVEREEASDGDTSDESGTAAGGERADSESPGQGETVGADADAGEEIDDDELAAIRDEVEANNPATEPGPGEVTDESTSIVDGPVRTGGVPESDGDEAAGDDDSRAGTSGDGDDDDTEPDDETTALDLSDPDESADRTES